MLELGEAGNEYVLEHDGTSEGDCEEEGYGQGLV